MPKTLLENLLQMLKKYKFRFSKAFVMVLISNGLLILNPLIFREAVGALDPSSGATSGFLHNTLQATLGPYQKSVATWIILLLSIAITASFFKYKMRIEFISVSRDVEKQVRSELFSRIQSQTMAFYDRHSIGELLSRLTNDISAYRDVLGPGIMYPLFFLTIVIPGLVALFVISPPLGVISTIPLLTIPILNYALRNKIYRLSHREQELLADLSSIAQEHYSGIRILKGYGIEQQAAGHFIAKSRQLMALNIRLITLMGLIYPFFTLLTKLVTVLLLLFTGILIYTSWQILSAADFVSFMWIQSLIFFPLLMLAWVLPMYQKGRAAYDRLLQIYEEPIEVKDTAKEDINLPEKADITFKDLTFTYPNTKEPVLNHLNLTIKGGTFVGITGPVGAGKSTLFHLLNREYEIPKGMIYIGGRDIHDYTLDSLHKQLVTVEQAPFLFSKTISENVRFGREEATREQMEMVAEYADLHETVMEFPEGYETIIGERGVTLSGGQKQRVAIARAFLVDRSILLLDDVFSAVDSATQNRIFHSMRKNLAGRTVLLITHRISILEQMDRVLYMTQGKVVEDGKPKELSALNGHYSALEALQRL